MGAKKKNTIYEYFSIATGLRIASKQLLLSENEIIKTNNTTIMEYEAYKEVNGILIPYKTIFYDENGSKEMEYVIQDIQFNVDVDEFQQNCFQKPEECFANAER